MDIDKWTAERCGVNLISSFDEIKCEFKNENGEVFWFKSMWTMQDARCREIVREHFRLTTEDMGDLFTCCTPDPFKDWCCGEGVTIEEAEIACITAIMNSEE